MTTKAGFKILTVQVPNEFDTTEIEGMVVSSWLYPMMEAMLREWNLIVREKEAARVPADSPLACVRCSQYRANHCSLCMEQVCHWCHWPDKDHHGGKVRPLHVHSLTYVMTDIETGAVVPHNLYSSEGDGSCFIREPLTGPCLTCGYEGHVYRLRYRDPESGPWHKKGVAYEAVCYACGAGDGNRRSNRCSSCALRKSSIRW